MDKNLVPEHRKIPKISPSKYKPLQKYKPPKSVMQKTLC